MTVKRFWINAGEFSGDMHGAMLVAAMLDLVPECEFIGMGGNLMATVGVRTDFRVESLSVMGITEVLGHLPKIFSLLAAIKEKMCQERPDALIVIDAPDFNFRVIKIARQLDIPVYYYISPKIWAWRQGRVNFIRKHVKKVLSILPFEVAFYKKFGMDVDYIGNPLVDLVNYPALSAIAPIDGRIGLLPGSRSKEVASLMPAFGGAARLLLEKMPELSFVCLKAPNMDEDFLRSFWPEGVPLDVLPSENRWAEMRRCEMLIAASGTVTLESAIASVPTLATYKVSPLSYLLGRMLVKVRYMSLANLILDDEVFPELIQERCDAEPLAEKVLQWIDPRNKEAAFRDVQQKLAEVRQLLGEPGAVQRAATDILNDFR